jgi:hypothetical protein
MYETPSIRKHENYRGVNRPAVQWHIPWVNDGREARPFRRASVGFHARTVAECR